MDKKEFTLALLNNRMVWLTIVVGVVIWLVQVGVIEMAVLREVLTMVGDFFKSMWPG